jgi:hypothetical protein
MTGCYLTTLPFEFMRATADFEPSWAGCYNVPRSGVVPAPWLRSQVFPQLEEWRDRPERLENKAAGAFFELVEWLRDVFLQDAVILQERFPKHVIFTHALFHTPQWQEFAVRLREIHNTTAIDDHAAQAEKLAPHVASGMRDLRGSILSQGQAAERRHNEYLASHERLRQQVEELQSRTLKITAEWFPQGGQRNTYSVWHTRDSPDQARPRTVTEPACRVSTPGGSPLPPPSRTAADLAAAETMAGLGSSVAAEGARQAVRPTLTAPVKPIPPKIKLPRDLHSVADLHKWWRNGAYGLESVDALEARWGSSWRLPAERQLFSMRKRVIDEVTRRAAAQGWPEEDMVREMDRERGKRSLDALSKAIREAKKAAKL